MKARLNRGTWEVLVSWLDRPPTESTWEKFDAFKKAYPDIQLEDKLFLGKEGNVIDAFLVVSYCYGSTGRFSTARLTRRRDQNAGNSVEYFDYRICRGDESSPQPKS
jgi:hypothetical protein